jgi:uncharacterized protein
MEDDGSAAGITVDNVIKDQLRLLKDLQNIDTIILNLRARIDSLPSLQSKEEESIKAFKKVYEEAKQVLEQSERKKRDQEQAVEDQMEKIKKLKARSGDIKTNKEYQSLLKEIEQAEADVRSGEDRILALMETIEGAAKTLKDEGARLKAEESMVKARQETLDAEVHRCSDELKIYKEDRKSRTTGIDPEFYQLYMTTLKACRGLAVVEARDEMCQGCNLHIPPQMFVEIKQDIDIFQCPQCRRILYYGRDGETTETQDEKN